MIPEINLLPAYEREDNRAAILWGSVFLVWLLLLAFVIIQLIVANSEKDMLELRITNLQTEKATLEKALEEKGGAPNLSIGDTVKIAESLKIPTTPILGEINGLLGNGALSTYSFNGQEVSIQTSFQTLVDVAAFIEKLNQHELFSRVSVNSIAEAGDGETEIYIAGFKLGINRHWLLDDGGENDE